MNEHDDIELGALVALDVILHERSVTRAAKRLGVTQSAVSHTLRRLRDNLGDPILVGARNDLRLTPRAEAIREPLRRALTELRTSVRPDSEFAAASSTRTFTVATGDYGEFWAMHDTLTILRRDAPRVSLRVVPPGRDILDELTHGPVDIFVGPKRPWPSYLRQRSAARDGFVVVGRENHPAFRSRLTLRRYLTYGHIAVGPGNLIDEILERRGASRREVILHTQNFVGAPLLAAQSDLLATIPMGLFRASSRMVALGHAAPPFEIPSTEICVVWHERFQKDAGHTWLRNLVNTVMKNL
jgi:DNA-binding transcriptional LysR family regulator